MSPQPARRIVIVGGGTAGWMSAAALSTMLKAPYEIHVVESDEIGTIGVGEATIPHIRLFNQAIGIDEDEFVRQTQGSFKLGIEFVNWGGLGDRYVHGFGTIGHDLDGTPFHHWWLRRQAEGRGGDLAAASINTSAPLQARFMRPRADMKGSPLAEIAYAFHFDASLYARFLRRHAEARGVQRHEGRIVRVHQREGDGFVSAVELAGGRRVEGDFFIDCSGIRALLMEQTLGVGYEDWRHWLPCDRAIAIPCESTAPLLPMTRSTAHRAGWQWRIPLQHRTGNGHVYCSRFISDDEAQSVLLSNLDGAPLAEPRMIRFTPGRRLKFWDRNCVAVGLASGFLEPLESTSIHLIQTAITRVIQFFPHVGFDAADIAEYNAQTHYEYERIRDFLILHYHATERSDSPFWNHCRTMEVPASLQHRMALFRSNGRVLREGHELFAEASWFQVMWGQRLRPRAYHPLAGQRPIAEVQEFVDGVEQVIARCVGVMPTHAQFIADHCAARPPMA